MRSRCPDARHYAEGGKHIHILYSGSVPADATNTLLGGIAWSGDIDRPVFNYQPVEQERKHKGVHSLGSIVPRSSLQGYICTLFTRPTGEMHCVPSNKWLSATLRAERSVKQIKQAFIGSTRPQIALI